MRQIICDDSDLSRWKAERRKRFTASEINIILGTAPSFYSDTAAEVVARKIDGTEKVFDERSQRRVMHGREREANALRMTGLLLGYPTVPFHHFVSNDRWPYIGATLDGIILPEFSMGPRLSLTSQPLRALQTEEALKALRGPVLAEIKVSDGGHRYKDKAGPTAGLRAWVDYCPTYHMEQIQTQMALAEIGHCVLAGSLGADDLIVWLIEADPAWAEVLDEANKQAFEALGEIQ